MTKEQDCNCDCVSTYEPVQSCTLELSPEQVRQLIQQKFARALGHRILHLDRDQIDADAK